MSSQVYQGSSQQDPKGFRSSDWYSISVDSVRLWMALLCLLGIAVAGYFGYGGWRDYWVEQRAFEWVNRCEGLLAQLETVPPDSVAGFAATLGRADGLVDDARDALAQEQYEVASISAEAGYELLEDLLARARLGSSIAWVRSVRGDVRFRRGESGEFVRAFARTELQEGDYVMSGEGGTAEIHFRGEDTVFTLRPDTLVKLSRGKAGTVRTLGEMEYGWVALDTAEQSSGVSTRYTSVVASEHSSASLSMERGSTDAVVRVEEGRATATAIASGDTRALGGRQQVSQSGDRFGDTVDLLPAPTLDTPEDGTSVNIDTTERVELSWTSVPDASAYLLQVTRGRLFADNAVDDRVAGTRATLALEEEGRYHWRVAAVDSAGRPGIWSDVWRLRVESYRSLAIEPDREPPTITVEVRMNGSFAVLKGRTEPGATLTVDGEPVPTAADGSFSTTYGVPGTGRRILEFRATDLSGNSTIERREVWIDEF